MNNLLLFYRKEATTSAAPIIFMGVIAGVAQSLLLGIITIAADTASHDNLNFQYFLLFVIAFGLMFVGRRYAMKKATIIVERVIKNVRVRLSDKIRKAELLFLENLGTGELYTRLANDTTVISQSAVVIVNACQSAIIVFFCLLFVAILSKAAFVVTIIASIIATANYIVHLEAIHKELRETLRKESKFFDMINQILRGFKELRINRKKSDDYFSFFTKLASETRDLKIKIGFRYITSLMYSQVVLYLLLGVIVFILPRFEQIDAEMIIRITAAILFLMGPMNSTVNAIPAFSQANAAIEHLYFLEAQLDAASETPPKKADLPARSLESFTTITFENLAFSYTDQNHTPLFTVGPLDLAIQRGEILFLIGGNGSGKTTLLKVLTGLYHPDTGMINVDETMITPPLRQAYRELFSIIFMDFHLFDRLYGLDVIDHEKIQNMLHLMELEKKTALIDGEFSNLHLSTGQRKRLALIVALLDDRPLYVFDEWAADQDPHFRKYFYEVLLQTLKAQGKTIIAVSHDDRYFHVADRVIKMDYGQFVELGVEQPPSS